LPQGASHLAHSNIIYSLLEIEQKMRDKLPQGGRMILDLGRLGVYGLFILSVYKFF